MLVAIAQERISQELAEACGEDPGFFCRKAYEWSDSADVAEIADFVLGKPLTIIAIVVIAYVVNRIVRKSLKRGLMRLHGGGMQDRFEAVRGRGPAALLVTEEVSVRAEQRIQALATVLRSVSSFVIGVIAVFMVMAEVGVELGPLLAGAGIIGVALGFGSQSLVRDFLSGIFILVEDQFGVGDFIDVGEADGTVEAVSLRTTRLRAIDGTVWHVPNGEIRRVGNQSQHWSRALLDIELAKETDVELARSVIKRVADEVWRATTDVLEAPEVWGVERLDGQALVLRLVVKTRPSEQWTVARDLRERLKVAFEAEGIALPPLLPRMHVPSGGTGLETHS